MRTPRLASALLACLALTFAARAAESALGWPEITRDNKPWTRWWWPGSAVDKASLTRQLEQIAAAGLGGVEITPIYGAFGAEDRYIDFISPKWMEMLEHVGHEGKRLGLGIDMATGTGWPFGGPWIDGDAVLQRAILKDGKLTGDPTKMLVKRAAPGDEGFVVDPYSPDALRRYLAPIGKAFEKFPRGLIRSQFHDSFEYYNGSWTPKFAETFQQMHGYDVQKFATEILAPRAADVKTIDADTLARVKSDYRDTLAKLHLDYLRTWVEWSHERGFLVRNQSHGAPGNVLDLYANADIAETEIFGSTPFPIPGLRRNADEIRTGVEQDLPEPLMVRMASSASHVVGHNLSSSESVTWLREHFKESLSYVKPELDRILADGINHIFYHGTVFSPQDAAWPGWLFYASTQLNPNNPLWDDFSALNRYVARVQSVLQRGKPDNDVLLYWPVEDVWNSADGLLIQLTVHNVKWLTEAPFGKLARAFMDKGYSFDYISDAQLLQTKPNESSQIIGTRAIAPGGGEYKAIVVPATRRMPVATLQQLAKLAAAGVKVIFEKLPEDVPGYGRLEERRAEFKAALAKVTQHAVPDVFAALDNRNLPSNTFAIPAASREAIAESGISFIRRASEGGHDYFFTNLTGKKFAGWATLGVAVEAAAILDPLTGGAGTAALRPGAAGQAQIYLQLAPGESLIVRSATAAARSGLDPWPWREAAGAPAPIAGTWKIDFVKGGPELPPALSVTELKSWTDLGGVEAKRFAGTARYRVEFDAPAAKADDWLLDLGDVRETARVKINGKDVTTAWSLPYRVPVGKFLQPGKNVLELEVTNVAANRIRDMDGANDPARKAKWKIMREINFVNINYRPFDASGWALMPSGLLGPVTLTPLKAVKL